MGWRGVSLVSGWQFTASLCFYTVFAATAFVREGFGVSLGVTGLTVTAVMLGYTALLFGTGAATDAFGERPLLVYGLLALAAGMAFVAVAPTFPILLVALLFVGFAYATAMPATNRAAVNVAPPGREALAMNVKQVGVTAGSAAAALLVTWMATTDAATVLGPVRFDWQAAFLAGAGLAVVVAVVTALRYEGMPASGSLSVPDVRSLLDDRAYRGLLVSGFFLGAAVFTTTSYAVPHVTDTVAATAGVGGAVLATVQVTGSLGRLAGGELADRIPGRPTRGPALVLAAQAAVAGAGFLAVVVADGQTATWLAFGFLGVSMLGFPGVYYATMTALVDDDEVGAATAGGQSALNAGGLVAPPLFGTVAETVGYDAGWTGLAVLTTAAAAAVWVAIART
ncbi:MULTISPECIES: MFS transporter [Halolamina]|uniref:Predicted arabinose efflux permease, MFS family n=1 Tax=Halolamina pelagica TaxID=699431 RepID=A0A1I5R0Y3_9EURY|nr:MULTISPECIES: MFS transporter [Halolamina]NHX35635.1 MFS transporter [Halolamina sp. R1-12]SFP52178.1 Predicted arabinose efflux permease, MFS family [Halolamina pelagica]